MTTVPRAFLTYSYDSPDHKAWVAKLAGDLHRNGVETILDQWDLKPGGDLAQFMEQGVSAADRVVVVCSDLYVLKADAGTGGVGYEKMIITRELFANLSTEKFIPILRNNSKRTMPVCLGARRYLDFEDDQRYEADLEDLLRAIHNAPRVAKPPLGVNPFAASGAPSSALPPFTVSRNVFGDPWFTAAQSAGLPKVQAHGKTTFELMFGAVTPNRQLNQKQLLEAVRHSQIHTFGWPLGVVLDQQGMRPVPAVDGIVAEVEHGPPFYDTPQMDCWQLRRNGDFYLAQNLFEDRRNPEAIFFNTQIVRTTESLLFCRNLLTELGYASGHEIEFRIRHAGLLGRKLSSSNPNRVLGGNMLASVDVADKVVRFTHSLSDEEVIAVAKEITDPLFMVFDFFELDQKVLRQIASDFIGGRVT